MSEALTIEESKAVEEAKHQWTTDQVESSIGELDLITQLLYDFFYKQFEHCESKEELLDFLEAFGDREEIAESFGWEIGEEA